MQFFRIFLFIIFNFNFSLLALKRDKWIVITSINYPTKAIKQFAQLKGWSLVVVGDKKTPKDWQLSNCDYLDPEQQQKLGYNICKHLPWNHYTRKNIGYLYAIEHGAKIIFDTDDDNFLMSNTIPLLPESNIMLHCKSESDVINPYAYFGYPEMWPRGYPLEHIQALSELSFKNKNVRPLVQQFLVDGDPDVDAIYRLTKGIPYISFMHKPAISLEKGTLCPYNSQGTIYYYDAFWGLAIPITTSFRVCDIWRGYWVQRILWEIDACICFLSPAIVQERNAHNYLKDFMDELDLYTQSGNLVRFLNKWYSSSFDLITKIMDLTRDMISQNYFKEKEEPFMQAWLEDLQNIGYEFPKVVQ
jgi:hypothetical protein